MITQGSFTIILNENKNRVLLVKRKNIPIWDLPGGKIEDDVTPIACAVREVVEESGYIISVYKKIGEYHRTQFNDIQHIFLGKVVGGQEIKNGDETRKIKWFKLNSNLVIKASRILNRH